VHEALSRVHLVVLVKHSEVRRKHECLPECTYAHAFEAQAVAAAAPSPLYGGVGGQTTRDQAFCTRMTTEVGARAPTVRVHYWSYEDLARSEQR